MTMATSSPKNITTSFSCSLIASEVYANTKATILHAKYEKFSPTEVVDQCDHLSANHKSQITTLTTSFIFFPPFFRHSGQIYTQKCSIQLKDLSTPPIFCTPYPIPLVHQQAFQTELNHLVEKKVLRRISTSEWAFPTFFIPKKDGRVRWISDFRPLNKLLRRPRYFYPAYQPVCRKEQGFNISPSLIFLWDFIHSN